MHINETTGAIEVITRKSDLFMETVILDYRLLFYLVQMCSVILFTT